MNKKNNNVVDVAVIAEDSKTASGFGSLNLARDTAIPYISILQSGSPQLNPSKAEYIETAKAGQLYNTVTQEAVSELKVIPVFYHLRYVEWKPREQGGGFIASHSADSGVLGRAARDPMTNKYVLENGNHIVQTAYHYVLVLNNGGYQNAVISMASSQLKKSRRWNSLMLSQKIKGPSGMFTPPTYAFTYKLSTVSESNDRGSWFGFQVEKGEQVTDSSIYNEGKLFSTAASSGAIEAKPEEPKVIAKPQTPESNVDIPF
ncbi:MAG: hypothetical protein QGI65_09730 [SAR324 cluster bacterium]|jgi:hypothetical protein|nr:hypothetical protein [SAR324 cluster bacterium]|tara:strand:+ start:1678 stop:2457 length:780 start_codon:yes stop_codon:yes gene_type:complete